MTSYLLDTNIASHIIKGDLPIVRQRLLRIAIADLAISAVTEAELLYGLAKRDYPDGLTKRVQEFLIRVAVLPWTSAVAHTYADLRSVCERQGVTLSDLDMMIAAHAKAAGATLVTADKAFKLIPGRQVKVENWALPK